MIQTSCPSCKAPLAFDDGAGGTTVSCPDCGVPVPVFADSSTGSPASSGVSIAALIAGPAFGAIVGGILGGLLGVSIGLLGREDVDDALWQEIREEALLGALAGSFGAALHGLLRAAWRRYRRQGERARFLRGYAFVLLGSILGGLLGGAFGSVLYGSAADVPWAMVCAAGTGLGPGVFILVAKIPLMAWKQFDEYQGGLSAGAALGLVLGTLLIAKDREGYGMLTMSVVGSASTVLAGLCAERLVRLRARGNPGAGADTSPPVASVSRHLTFASVLAVLVVGVLLWQSPGAGRGGGEYGDPTVLAVSADGRMAVFVCRPISSPSVPHDVVLADLQFGGTRRQLKGHSKKVLAAAFSPDGGLLVSGSEDGTARLWDVVTGEERMQFKPKFIIDNGVAKLRVVGETSVFNVAVSPDSRYACCSVSVGETRGLVLLDLKRGVELQTLGGHLAVFSADSSHLLTLSHNVCLLKIPGGDEVSCLPRPQEIDRYGIARAPHVNLLGFHGDTPIAVGWERDDILNRAIHIWDLKTGKELQRIQGHTGRVRHAALSTDGRYLLSGSDDQTVRLWDIQTGQQIRRFFNYGPAERVAIADDGRTGVSSSFQPFNWAHGSVAMRIARCWRLPEK